MLESALEQLLLQFLEPYVDGITRDKLHLGVFSGSLVLDDLQVKPEALAILGWEGFRVRSGKIGKITLSIPWTKLYSGKVQASIESLHLEVESLGENSKRISEADLINEMRENKQKAIEVRMNQLQDLVESRREGEDDKSEAQGKKEKPGVGMKLVRKIISNITIVLKDVHLSFFNGERGLACGMEFPKLAVLSTDHTFRPRDDKDSSVDLGPEKSMYKLLQLQQLGIRMSPAGTRILDQAEYVLSPISASLQLAHVPSDNILGVKLLVATEEVAELTLRRSQVKHLRSVKGDLNAEARRHQEMLVPPEDERTIYKDAAASLAEYSDLYERFLLQAWTIAAEDSKPFSAQEERRKQLLEDALSARLLARARWKVRRKAEALNEEVARRQSSMEDARRAEQQKGLGFFGRLRGRFGPGQSPNAELAADELKASLITSKERDQLLRDLDDTSKVENVDLPQRFKFEFVLGKMALDLVDDRWSDEVRRQLLSLALREAQFLTEVRMATDHRGMDSAEWRLDMKLGSFHALHHTHPFMELMNQEARAKSISGNGPQASSSSQWLGDGSSAACFVLESKLEKEQNLLVLSFEFMPVEIHMLPGIVEMTTEFVRAPPRPEDDQPKVKVEYLSEDESLEGDTTLQVEEHMEMAKQWLELHGDRAKEVAQEVYQRIPDKLQIEVRIASPILHVPVASLGTAIFSLGHLHIKTPTPCEYASLDLGMELQHTSVRAISIRNEHFDMIQPVPIKLLVEYRSTDDANAITIRIQAEEMALSLAPQALQILLATPTGLMGVLYVPPEATLERPGTVKVDFQQPKAERQNSNATQMALLASKVFQAASSEAPGAAAGGDGQAGGQSHEGHKGQQLMSKASKMAHEVLGKSQAEGLVEAAQKKVQEVRSKQFTMNMNVQFDAIEVTLADSIVPVLRWRMELLPPGLVMYKQKEPNLLTVNIANGSLDVQCMNVNSGVWEPMIERFHAGVEVERKVNGENKDTHVIIGGHEPMLLNVTPTMVKRWSYIMPLFIESLTASSLLPAKNVEVTAKIEGAKYRVVNLTDSPVELKLRSRFREGLVAKVNPTGSDWVSLDEWVLPHFATALTAELHHGPSEWLSLEQTGAVPVPGSGCVAELLTPSPSHRLLLISSPLRIHNQTDLTLLVRFHDADRRAVLPVDIKPTAACEASLLGKAPPKYEARSHYTSAAQRCIAALSLKNGELVLPPNSLCAVPPMALFRSNQELITSSHAWLSIRPVGLDVDFCIASEAGAAVETSALFCRGPDQGSVAGGISSIAGVHFLCPSKTYVHALPSPLALTTIALQPTLAVLNALPLGNLALRYTTNTYENRFLEATEVRVPCFTRWHIYSFPGVRREGISVIAKFDTEAPWSNPVTLTQEAFKSEGTETGQIMQMRQRKDGGAASILVEALNHYEMRFVCPNWFVDRSGIQRPLSLTLHHDGNPLPREGGITLLPSECLEDTCELVLQAPGQSNSSTHVRMPPNFSVFPWKTTSGSFVLCLQAEDLDPGDMHGAQCQAFTVRPSMVFTNSSSSDIELRLGENKMIRLEPGQSKEHHWQVKANEEDAPTCTLQFRPARSIPGGWSAPFICGDVSAGTTPFALATGQAVPFASGSTRVFGLGSEIWSVQVSPNRGALAVSVKQGSDFIAANQSKRPDVSMSIRPVGLEDDIASFVVGPGEEVKFGWSKPFVQHGGAVEVTVEIGKGRTQVKCKVDDVRRASRKVLQKLGLALVSGRIADATLLSLEDYKEVSGGLGKPLAARVVAGCGINNMHVEIKISRLGISILEELPRPRELLFWTLELIRFDYQKDNNLTQYKLAISETQVDCQLSGRSDLATSLRRSDETLGPQGQERPAVILANCGEGDRAFLVMVWNRGVTSSTDILIPIMDIALDTLDITVDDGWLDPLQNWLRHLRENSSGRGMAFSTVSQFAGRPIVEGYEPPPLPAVIQVDSLHISKIELTVWCALKLRTVRFLPQYLRTAIRVLSFSGQLTLDGAGFELRDRKLPPHRGSLADFVRGLTSEYTMNILNNAAGILGKSSVLNLPRVPLRIGMTGVSYITDSIGLAAGEASSLLNALTFDDEYVARQRQLRNGKSIQNIGDGFAEAGKSLAQGVEGLFDVVSKPMQGAAQDGIGGFFGGLAKGVVGTFVKPVSKLGQAISDVGSGIASQISPDSIATKRRRKRPRARQPRLLFAELGVVRPWSVLEAELKRQLGDQLVHGVEEVLPLTGEGRKQLVLMLFPQRLVIVELKFPDFEASPDPARASGGGGSSSSSSLPDKDDGYDIFDAVDESALRLFSQVLKPINTVVYGVQDIENSLTGNGSRGVVGPDPEVLRRAVKGECKFSHIKAVHTSTEGGFQLRLEDRTGNTYVLPMVAANLGQVAWEALANGFRSAISNNRGIANWDELRAALQEERKWRKNSGGVSGSNSSGRNLAKRNGAASGGAGQRICEVFEVERKDLVTLSWRTPSSFNPLDREFSWRWLDATGYRHPHILRQLNQEQCALRKSPPIEMDDGLYKAKSDWSIQKGSGADKDGWMYGIAWNSSTWEDREGFFDTTRKRRWTRIYT